MNSSDLKMARSVLMLTVEEAAKHIGRVPVAVWMDWETSSRWKYMYSNADERLVYWLKKREELIDMGEGFGIFGVSYCATYQGWLDENEESKTSAIEWRLSQSVDAYFSVKALLEKTKRQVNE